MHYKTEIHRKFVHASAEDQNPKQGPEIWFSVSHHISAKAIIENMQYKTEIHRQIVYAHVEIRNPKRMPKYDIL